jgi:hypothetical protein
MEAQIVALQSGFEAEELEELKIIGIEKARNERFIQDKVRMAKSRKSDVDAKPTGTSKRKTNAQRNVP